MRGFSMIEILVAMVVLSFGMLGIAGLYLESLRNGRSALYRAQAVNLAADMAERIRANRNAGIGGNAYALSASDAPMMQSCVAATLGCTPIALAQDDLSRWLVAIHDTLPGDGANTPSGTIAVDSSRVPILYTITVTWAEPGEALPMSYVLRIQA